MGFFVITGGPGVGKTSLIEALQLRGYKTVAENARAIIRAEQHKGGDALPWKDKSGYASRMLKAGVQHYQDTLRYWTGELVFFDRSVVDAVCYVEMENLTIEPAVMDEVKACIYEKMVFILPPWKEIYETDGERKQNWEEAQLTFDCLKKTYDRLGYTLVEVPRTTIEQRCAFVIDYSK